MNAKYIMALVLALQVSMSLCEAPTPSDELANKYQELKTKFFSRFINAYNKMQEAAAPLVEKVEGNEHGQAVKTYLEDLQASPRLQAFVKIAKGLGQEAVPLVDTARASALGAYEQNLRPHVGPYLNDFINYIKGYLDILMPAE
uniref:apolipoprotein A-II n=1 Tax=Solea senegalensis TaxID=28829 RepID=UPI001CD8FE97|nr:apolipoprotein A-II [Solea senegalensis]